VSVELETVRWSALNTTDRRRVLGRPVTRQSGLRESVARIIEEVREGGDRALMELTRRFDGTAPVQPVLGSAELQAAAGRSDPELIRSLNDAGSRIEAFHKADMPKDRRVETAPGLICEVRYQPLSPVGLYIPGGSAPLVSTVLMLAIPARLAACPEVIMCTPPAENGRVPDEVLTAAQLCGVHQVFAVGGAQAIAAMAYGTATVPRCSKIFGPGNAWVTAAKQQVSQDPEGAAIDMPAGPSEVLVIADAAANPDFVAWDLMSQAEHGPDSQVILVTDSAELASAVIEQVGILVKTSNRRNILEQSLSEARIIRVTDLAEAVRLSNEYAPEHLIINTGNARKLAQDVKNAGSVFIGPWTPESLGDYCSGTNHVLPTYGWARSHGALGVGDYLRRTTFQEASRSALEQVGPTAEALASVEGLDAHRMAVKVRRNDPGEKQ
jgi:histidinol dehydrogenase